ncbi:MAG: molybdenum cofactor biosynthesis protein MoaE [Candidatus Eremiobacteraeota bacterium]|nr:molybdenum cofactor biosynthesis protein MoaE [Candidatus Eremiobacteraeota bacterium]
MLELTKEPIALEPLIIAVRNTRYGAVVAFVGTVRDRSDDERPVSGLSYEAYEAMVTPQLRAIAADARERFGDCAVAILHRIGEVCAGDPSVAVAVAAPHRREAFGACEFAINELKARASIWKKEHYVDAPSVWRENPHAGEMAD